MLYAFFCNEPRTTDPPSAEQKLSVFPCALRLSSICNLKSTICILPSASNLKRSAPPTSNGDCLFSVPSSFYPLSSARLLSAAICLLPAASCLSPCPMLCAPCFPSGTDLA